MFTQAEKDELNEMMSIPFDLFKESVIAYKNAKETILSSASNYNFAFPTNDVTYVPQSGQFNATVQHMSSLTDQKFGPAQNSPIQVSHPFVKICVTGEIDKEFFQDIEKLIVDNLEFKPATKVRPRGILDRTYHEFYFERID